MSADTTSTTAIAEATNIASEVFDHLVEAWNRADGSAFGAHFADDADFVDIRGAHHHGAIAITHGHQAILDTIYSGSTIAYRVETARRIGPGQILALVAATLDTPSGPGPRTATSRITVVLTDEGDRWRIAAFQNTLIQR